MLDLHWWDTWIEIKWKLLEWLSSYKEYFKEDYGIDESCFEGSKCTLYIDTNWQWSLVFDKSLFSIPIDADALKEFIEMKGYWFPFDFIREIEQLRLNILERLQKRWKI